jgi:selenide, water dikinase
MDSNTMQVTPFFKKDLLLIGGGHSHALVAKMWAMNPVSGVRLTLVSPQVQTPYSGMLPGLISGHYSFEQTHIDLSRLCKFTGIRHIQSEITRIDLQQKQAYFANRPAISFDVASINCGITPNLAIPGAEQFAIPVKPIAQFYPRWQQLLKQLTSAKTEQNIVIVGGGAAGIELILSMQYAISQQREINIPVNFRLVQLAQGLPENYPLSVQKYLSRLFQQRHIFVSHCAEVTQVKQNQLCIRDQEDIHFDYLFWCTQAKAATWPAESGLAVDKNNFIQTNQYLQSTSHDFIFAAGDVAQHADHKRPKAGVYAVRQAPHLYKNLLNFFKKQQLKAFKPQKTFLSLLACGNHLAIGCRPGQRLFPTIAGHWVWRWKDHIDQKFMNQFSGYENLKMTQPAQNNDEIMHCGGCGSKIGANILHDVIGQLNVISHDNIISGLHHPDDASAISLPDKTLLVQSVDVFRSLLDDLYLLGKIAAEHALSDLFAMNSQPHSALAIITLPFAHENINRRDLAQIMQGSVEVFNSHGCALIGGHSSEGQELNVGFSVNGFCQSEQMLQKGTVLAGHQLILTKALGTGTLFAAHQQFQAEGKWIAQAVSSMLQSNKQASQIFADHQASACTDITGFGLLGHLLEMLTPNSAQANINLTDLPILEGASHCLSNNIESTMAPQNRVMQYSIKNQAEANQHPAYPILFDPQTSGGLLASVPQEQVESCLAALHQAGYVHASLMGKINSSNSQQSPLIVVNS